MCPHFCLGWPAGLCPCCSSHQECPFHASLLDKLLPILQEEIQKFPESISVPIATCHYLYRRPITWYWNYVFTWWPDSSPLRKCVLHLCPSSLWLLEFNIYLSIWAEQRQKCDQYLPCSETVRMIVGVLGRHSWDIWVFLYSMHCDLKRDVFFLFIVLINLSL